MVRNLPITLQRSRTQLEFKSSCVPKIRRAPGYSLESSLAASNFGDGAWWPDEGPGSAPEMAIKLFKYRWRSLAYEGAHTTELIKRGIAVAVRLLSAAEQLAARVRVVGQPMPSLHIGSSTSRAAPRVTVTRQCPRGRPSPTGVPAP